MIPGRLRVAEPAVVLENVQPAHRHVPPRRRAVQFEEVAERLPQQGEVGLAEAGLRGEDRVDEAYPR